MTVQQTTEEKVKTRIVETADKGLDIIDQYFDGKETDSNKVNIAFRIVGQSTKVMHMNQVKVFTERSQALRLLPWLSDESAREQYIRMTNPQIAPKLLHRPKKQKATA